jgi:hypothetical protein
VAAMEEHKAMVPARKSKCAVPLMKSKIEAMATEIPIYGGGGNGAAIVASMVQWRLARFGIADSSLFDDNWCCIGATNSTMAEVALPAPSLHGWFPFPSSPPPNWCDIASNCNSITSQFGHLSAWDPAR